MTETVGGIIVFAPHVDFLDATNRDEFRAALEAAIAPGSRVVIDFSSVRFVDSSGLGVIITELKKVRADGGDMAVCSIEKPVRQLFNLVRLDRIIKEFADKAAAVASFKRE